jgi:hypothetical protein
MKVPGLLGGSNTEGEDCELQPDNQLNYVPPRCKMNQLGRSDCGALPLWCTIWCTQD